MLPKNSSEPQGSLFQKQHKKTFSGTAKGPNSTHGAFFVRDNGDGIPERLHSKIFEMFQQAKLGKEKGTGTGAGLAIVKRIMEMHKAMIWVESTLGEGSTFYFTLPVADVKKEKETESHRILKPTVP